MRQQGPRSLQLEESPRGSGDPARPKQIQKVTLEIKKSQ